MKINLAKFVEKLSVSVDYVEQEMLKVKPYHCNRVAAISNKMGIEAGMSEDVLYAMAEGAFLHDCALKEYMDEELGIEPSQINEANMKKHCDVGEETLRKLPFYSYATDTVRYHHERADGKGAFGLKADETPLTARFVHLADITDLTWGLDEISEEKHEKVCSWIKENTGSMFDEYSAELFLKAFSYDFACSIDADKSADFVDRLVHTKEIEIAPSALVDVAAIFAFITDFKSNFTRRHSMGIAEKARIMGEFYGYDEETCDKLYIAGAVHDVGKLMVGNHILEKPGKLTDEEYVEIQNHAVGTHMLLDDIEGFEEIASWASNHHEKLDGKGYPYGKTGDQLGRMERLMACIDIYQALVETRPYKEGFLHEDAMGILNKMGNAGQLDAGIIADIDKCFGDGQASKGKE